MSTMNKSIIAGIGNTPIFKLNRLVCEEDADVYVKLEYFNPGGSIKDRTALGMVEDAESRGLLKPGMIIIESSSGNTAIGLSVIAACKGYRVIAVCDRNMPQNKRYKLRSHGADIAFLPPTPEGMDTVELRIEVAKRLVKRIPNSLTLLQYDNLANRDYHYRTTGQEIWRDTGGRVDACVISVGTCGTISGIGRALKEKNPEIRIVGVEPEGSIIFGGPLGPYLVQGGGLSFIPRNLDRTVIDEGIKLTDQESFAMARRLALEEGILAGGTGGAAALVAIRMAKQMGKGKIIVAVIPDTGDRYLDNYFSDTWLKSHRMSDIIPERPLPPIIYSAAAEEECSINEFKTNPTN